MKTRCKRKNLKHNAHVVYKKKLGRTKRLALGLSHQEKHTCFEVNLIMILRSAYASHVVKSIYPVGVLPVERCTASLSFVLKAVLRYYSVTGNSLLLSECINKYLFLKKDSTPRQYVDSKNTVELNGLRLVYRTNVNDVLERAY